MSPMCEDEDEDEDIDDEINNVKPDDDVGGELFLVPCSRGQNIWVG